MPPRRLLSLASVKELINKDFIEKRNVDNNARDFLGRTALGEVAALWSNSEPDEKTRTNSTLLLPTWSHLAASSKRSYYQFVN